MTDTDTSAEAVERLAEFYFDRASFGFIYGGTTVEGAQEWNAMMKTRAAQAHATLRALLARAEKADAERDRLRAERDEAREVLRGALAAMQAIHPDARGDMTDARIASLWNAALAAAEALLKEAGHD